MSQVNPKTIAFNVFFGILSTLFVAVLGILLGLWRDVALLEVKYLEMRLTDNEQTANIKLVLNDLQGMYRNYERMQERLEGVSINCTRMQSNIDKFNTRVDHIVDRIRQIEFRAQPEPRE